jgi:hypothetical protein
MRPVPAAAIMLVMTSPSASPKVLLIADRRTTTSEPGTAPLRRYRLARLRFEGRVANAASRFEHLKRVYD